MSDTRRKVDRGWGPGHPGFDKWNSQQDPQRRVKSIKHQARDRRGCKAGRKRNG